GARDPGDQREVLRDADRQSPLPIELFDLASRSFADPVAKIEQEAIDDQDRGGDRGRGEYVAEELAEERADHDRRNGRQENVEERPPARRRAASRAADEGAREIEPVAPEEGEERDRRAQMH